MVDFSPSKVQQVLQLLKPDSIQTVPEDRRLAVHAALTRFAVLYERIRNAVDYKDDHLLRKAAIRRILRRQMMLESDPAEVSSRLIHEMIAARYLPNATLPETLVGEVALILQKFFSVRRSARTRSNRHQDWLLGIVSAEIEERLSLSSQDKRLVHFLFEQVGNRVMLRNGHEISDEDRRLQVSIACYRALCKADDEVLGFKLVRIFYPKWLSPDEWLAEPRDVALQLVGVEQEIKQQLAHPLSQKFLSAVKPWAVSLAILRDVLCEQPAKQRQLFDKPAELKAEIAKAAERRYVESRIKLRRGTWRAIIYLLLTKMIIALALEVPFETFLYKQVRLATLAINVSFPPLLMLLIGRLIRVPGKDNVERIQRGVEELLSEEGPPIREIKAPPKQSAGGRTAFAVTYAMTFLLTFGGTAYLLRALHFTSVSAAIFIFFLCIVSFFAYRLRVSAREYVVVEQKEKFSAAVMDFFFLPILRAGQWLSRSVSRINVLIFFFDFFIEMPFKNFLNILEAWFAFTKEKKEQLQ